MVLAVGSTLVVAAYPPELAGLGARLPTLATRAVGVGLVEAAAGCARVLAELTPRALVHVGTAGALPGAGLAVGALAVAAHAVLLGRAVELLPAITPARVAADAALTTAVATRLGLPAVTVASTLGVTNDDAEAERLAHSGAALEQLECFAVLQAAARAGVPATALLAVSNRVGSGGSAEWRRHAAVAEAAAIDALVSLIIA